MTVELKGFIALRELRLFTRSAIPLLFLAGGAMLGACGGVFRWNLVTPAWVLAIILLYVLATILQGIHAHQRLRSSLLDNYLRDMALAGHHPLSAACSILAVSHLTICSAFWLAMLGFCMFLWLAYSMPLVASMMFILLCWVITIRCHIQWILRREAALKRKDVWFLHLSLQPGASHVSIRYLFQGAIVVIIVAAAWPFSRLFAEALTGRGPRITWDAAVFALLNLILLLYAIKQERRWSGAQGAAQIDRMIDDLRHLPEAAPATETVA